ncbi:hypothetical protein JW898_03485 [Candidatus Woesearchaeota archaeon]|nr:hypothetical protein [Candidatus Woesearchaeota archaeon]
MPAKKRKVKAMPKVRPKAKAKARKPVSRKHKVSAPVMQQAVHTAAPVSHPRVEDVLKHELEHEAKDLFYAENWSMGYWLKRYSPVLITMLIGLATYFYLVFYLFYPATLLQGHYIQLLILLVFIFLIAGLLIYLGLRAELLFVRILSFIFVFVIFTFLLLFILLAFSMNLGG